MLRLLAIGIVWLGCTFAWVVLGGTIVHRSGASTFFWKGYTGLAITAGAIATLFVIMQITGRLDWSGVFDGARRRGPLAPPRPQGRDGEAGARVTP